MLLLAVAMLQAADPALLPRAHAHNDYAHARPLEDALINGFCSVEADVFLVDGKLLVGHDKKDLKPERTLEALYLKPLLNRVRRNLGSVYAKRAPFTLLVDIKEDGPGVYAELTRELKPMMGILTRFDGQLIQGAVTVVISGERPIPLVEAETFRTVFVDGRPPDLDAKPSPSVYRMISDSFDNVSKWDGKGQMPADAREKIGGMVKRAHDQGLKIRFWATPDTEASWKALYDLGVDYINTDSLTELARFLRNRERT